MVGSGGTIAPPAPAAGRSRRRDLLLVPGVGRFFRWRGAPVAARALMLLLAVLIVLDGFFGPQLAHRNLAGVLPWVHWRGFLVLALLVAGNLFCFACPFMLPRALAKRWLPARLPWPRALRGKWGAAGLTLLFFWSYEAFDLWSSPALTAWIIVGYFGAAFLVDGLFRGATFCKHVCPIGQFNFVHSTLSPFEVAVRDPEVCERCRTKDCIRGRRDQAAPRRGCELGLFQPRKVGNLDCTFCMDCVHACPHGNLGILSRPPLRDLSEDPWRSGIGRLSERPDLAFLALILSFSAFTNAFGMVAPVHAFAAWAGETLGLRGEGALVGLIVVGGGALLPAGLALIGGAGSARWMPSGIGPMGVATRFAWGLVPVGFGMWLAHYLIHLLGGGLTVVPVVHQYLADLGVGINPPASWALGPVLPVEILPLISILLLEAGFLASVILTWSIARRETSTVSGARRAALPWWGLALVLSATGIWLLLQPMDMRGFGAG